MLPLTILTVFTAGALGGAIAVGVTALVVVAAILLALLAVTNGLRILGAFWAQLTH